jgi:hypothetical protein
MADQAEQVRATYNSIISVLGPLVRSIPMDALEKADLASTSVVSGRNFRYKVMTFNPHRIFLANISHLLLETFFFSWPCLLEACS